jgi:arginine deiminase
MNIDAAHGGEAWQARVPNFAEDLGVHWSPCGIDSECGRLRTVLLHQPGREIEQVIDPIPVLWTELLDPSRAREQHEALCEYYRTNGITVHMLDTNDTDHPNLYFMRDIVTMTPQGAILSRLAGAARAGEEQIVAKNLALLGIPQLLCVYGAGFFEGPDLVFASPELAFLGIGIRTNLAGALQIKFLLETLHIQTHLIQTTYGCGHLDGVMNIVDHDKAILYPTRVSYHVYDLLKLHGFKIIDLPDEEEAQEGMAINMVAMAPGWVVMPKGNTKTRAVLEHHGIQCDELDVSELMKGGGAIHCMTGIIHRDPLW